VLSATTSSGEDRRPGRVKPKDAQQAVLAAFDKYQAVGGFSASHGNKEVDDFLLDLLRNPALADKVDDIAVEGGNALYQGLLDDYIAGVDVALADVRKVWRNTTGPNAGFSTFYEQLFPLVRRVNARLPAAKRFRVLACDPPIDWSKITSPDDLEPFLDRDASIAAVIERESLAKGRKVLLLFGIHHLQHGPDNSSAVARYEANGYVGVTYVIGDHRGFANNSALGKDNDELEARMASWPTPSIMPIAGTWLGRLDAAYFDEPEGEKGYPGVDAYLYVGPRDLLLREPRSAQAIIDEDYIAELEQRAASIDEPPDGPMWPANGIRRELQGSVFSYVPH
jgi:hypothetical protein